MGKYVLYPYKIYIHINNIPFGHEENIPVTIGPQPHPFVCSALSMLNINQTYLFFVLRWLNPNSQSFQLWRKYTFINIVIFYRKQYVKSNFQRCLYVNFYKRLVHRKHWAEGLIGSCRSPCWPHQRCVKWRAGSHNWDIPVMISLLQRYRLMILNYIIAEFAFIFHFFSKPFFIWVQFGLLS